jgi:superfamily II DNA or RNA helicase
MDLLTPPLARYGEMVVTDRALLLLGNRGPGQRRRWDQRVVALLHDGPDLIPPDEVAEYVEQLRYAQDRWEDEVDEETDSDVAVVVDPSIGVRYFLAEPKPVLRLDGSPARRTVDVVPLARYVNPDDASVIVDRDARDGRLVEDPDRPLATVPCGRRAFEERLGDSVSEVVRRAGGSAKSQWRVPREKLPALLRAAAKRGYAVELQKQRARAGGRWSLSVASGIDWFELSGELQTPEGAIPLAELVRAARAAPNAVEILPLADGSTVVLPKTLRAVLRKLSRILTARDEGAMRFSRSEALLVDVLLESADRRRDDAAFRSLRARLASIELPAAVAVPESFVGTLRDYQQHSLAWFAGLRALGMGGCLADEMGLGKTVQVLAMLADEHGSRPQAGSEPRASRSRKRGGGRQGAARHPTLLVVPRSIVRNWLDEAARFAPHLRVVDCSQGDRTWNATLLAEVDVAVVTYGTLLRDVETLAQQEFHYVILDEAQAIKNETARTTKATKCLKAQHRLAMTGTPIENHLGELWSLMEFLNPALAARLELLAGSGEADDLATVRRAVRPFLLRRTKREVAKELPDRIEQTLHCDMTSAQRSHYDELLKRIRSDLLGRSEAEFGRAKLEVLEGLLRLRQIACHPSLVDPARKNAGSGKLEALFPMLEESAEEGRKTLVFSQFTSFLALVRAELDARGITYEYLDGQTRDRAERVRRFVTDEHCSTFLLSLKAGGVGLNLQCAERVILLDPWWNPAVEAQAIDRTHRIGQTRTVHAVRLVSSGTVEDRVLDLQSRKRSLADAIVGGESGPLAAMTREDLRFLLGA